MVAFRTSVSMAMPPEIMKRQYLFSQTCIEQRLVFHNLRKYISIKALVEGYGQSQCQRYCATKSAMCHNETVSPFEGIARVVKERSHEKYHDSTNDVKKGPKQNTIAIVASFNFVEIVVQDENNTLEAMIKLKGSKSVPLEGK